MGRNSRDQYHQYKQIADFLLELGEAFCADGLTAKDILELIREKKPQLCERMSRGRSPLTANPLKYLKVTLHAYSGPLDSRPAHAEPRFLKVSSGWNSTRYTLKPEIWARQRSERQEAMVAQRRERERAKRLERKAQASAMEGAKALRIHLLRERSSMALVFKRQLATLRCEACGFSFAEHYGQDAATFIEAHHKRPLAAGSRRTTVEDFNAVCANCHRMLHWQGSRTVEQLRLVVAKQRQSVDS